MTDHAVEGPQPEVVRLADEGELRGDVLVLGCGAGADALFLAARGHPVVGVDRDAAAVERARAAGAAQGARAAFLAIDALELASLRHRFTSALDCAVFHLLGDADRPRYVESVAAVLGPGGVLQLLCVSDEETPGERPRRVSQYELRAAFRGPFVATRIREARLVRDGMPGGARAWLASLIRA